MKTTIALIISFYSITLLAQINIVSDGGFENWTNPTTLINWTIENDVSQNTTDFIEGTSSASLKIGSTNLNPKVITQAPLVSGVTFDITYKYKYVDANFGGTHPVCIKLVRAGSGTTKTKCSIASDNLWNTVSTTFTPDQTGDYDLSISTSNFSDGQSFEVLIDDVHVSNPATATINNINNNTFFKLYPTISNQYVQFETLEHSYSIIVYDIYGKKQNVKIELNSIDLSLLDSGIYFVNFKSNNKNSIIKIIKK